MTEQQDRVDPNSASLEDLQRLPGIGPSLAQRIIDARPFESSEDLRRVPGLGEAAISRLKPHLGFASSGPVDESPAPPPAGPLSSTQEPPVEPAPPRAGRPSPTPRAPYSRQETLWLVSGSALASFLLSMILTLALLAGINGTLNFGRHQAVRQMEAELTTAQQTLDSTVGTLQSVSHRLEALEGLSGRMTTVEEQVVALRSDMDRALSDVGAMQASLSSLEQESQELSRQVGRFDAFLEGLQQLLGDTAPTPTPIP